MSVTYLKIMTPERSNFILTANIPNSEADVLVLDCLHIKSNCRNSCHDFSQLELVQDCCLSSSIQTHCNDVMSFIKTNFSNNLPINILICFFPNKRPNRLDMVNPILQIKQNLQTRSISIQRMNSELMTKTSTHQKSGIVKSETRIH